jgi:hypothetical protein
MNKMIFTLAILMAPVAAGADEAAADKCASGLLPAEKSVYDLAKSKLKPGDDVNKVAADAAQQLVFDGQIGRAVQKTAAGKAATCLAMMRQ